MLLAWGAYLDIPRLLTTPSGIVFGASFVDVNLRLYALQGLLVVAGLGAAGAAYAAFTRANWPVAAGVGAYLVVWIGGGGAATGLQQLVVTPDEQQREAPYLVHNIAATRQAFDLDAVEERAVSGDALLTLQDIEDNAETINNVRLWGPPAAARHVRADPGDPHLLRVRVGGQRPLRGRRRVPPDDALEPRAQLGQPAEPVLGQRAAAVHARGSGWPSARSTR